MKKILSVCFKLILILFFMICMFFFMSEEGSAEETNGIWILCSTDSFVNVREHPRKSSFAFGGVTCGMRLETDLETNGKYIHVINVPAEESEGWISKRYVVYSEPVRLDRQATVVSNGRLAARNGVDGKVQHWMNPMDTLTIFWWTDEWCLTNKGYVKTEFLELDGED